MTEGVIPNEVLRTIETIFKVVTEEVTTKELKESPPLFVSALLGRVGVINSRAERMIVTMIGTHGVSIVKPFFTNTQQLEHPFDFRGTLKRNWRVYEVKVVSSVKAFNSTMRAAVERASYSYENPVILTLQGVFKKGDHVKHVGRARWLDAKATWALLTGNPTAYYLLKNIIYRIARPYRYKILTKIIEEAKR